MPSYTINLNSLPSGNIVIPRSDSVTFTATVQVQVSFAGTGRRGTPFSDGLDTFSVGPGNTDKEFSGSASGNYPFEVTPENGPSATGDIDVVSDVMDP